MMSDVEKIKKRWSSLKLERSSWDSHYRELSEFINPRSARFTTSDRNRGNKAHGSIIDRTARGALNILSAGLMSGATSPARPWFRLSLPDKDLMKIEAVQDWLFTVSELMREIFQRSNTYGALQQIYVELGLYGTAANIVVDDFDTALHNFSLTAGEYAIATDFKGRVNTIYREFDSTVEALVGEFGKENCSSTVQNSYDNGGYDKWVTVIHVVEPRKDRDVTKRDAANMPFKSCYVEATSSDGKYLRESGFRTFRGLCPRWDVIGGDIYGCSPAMEALGDIKQLQHEHLRKGMVIDYQAMPPLQAPMSLKNAGVDRLPGGISFVDQVGPQNAIRSAFDVNLNLQHLLLDIQDVRQRINTAFYSDLFLMASQDMRSNVTAHEIAIRQEEKLLMIGPVLERLHNELLKPLVMMAFDRIISAKGADGNMMVPPPPPELQGQELKVEFVSVLAQAQRAVTTGSVDRFVMNLGQIAMMKPEVLDKLDADVWADRYSDMLGIDPEMIVGGDRVAVIRKARAEQAQAAQQSALMQQGADTVKKLAGSPTGGQPNALTDVMQGLTGYSTGG